MIVRVFKKVAPTRSVQPSFPTAKK